jgi:hypothetical protein
MLVLLFLSHLSCRLFCNPPPPVAPTNGFFNPHGIAPFYNGFSTGPSTCRTHRYTPPCQLYQPVPSSAGLTSQKTPVLFLVRTCIPTAVRTDRGAFKGHAFLYHASTCRTHRYTPVPTGTLQYSKYPSVHSSTHQYTPVPTVPATVPSSTGLTSQKTPVFLVRTRTPPTAVPTDRGAFKGFHKNNTTTKHTQTTMVSRHTHRP